MGGQISQHQSYCWCRRVHAVHKHIHQIKCSRSLDVFRV